MKPLISQLVGLSALFAFIDANELPPQSIPIPCATICGPIVELTALCSKKRSIAISKSPMRRNIEHERLFDAPSSQNRGAHRHDKRLFVTLIPPPASPPRQQEQSTPQPSPLPSHPPPSQQQPQPQAPPQKQPPPAPAPPPASKTPEQKPPPPQQEKTSAAPPAETSRASGGKEKGPDAMSTSSAGSSRGQGSVTATMSPIPSMAGNSMAGMLDGDGGSSPDMDSSKGPESAEEICVCENRSFDVSTLTALCASCVASKSKLHDAASKYFANIFGNWNMSNTMDRPRVDHVDV